MTDPSDMMVYLTTSNRTSLELKLVLHISIMKLALLIEPVWN